ncbi:hypothetical protein [Pelotomaculum sp. PtaB.Bin117]|uniref:hypothetical protein n=1 Tax=Pelotomaculum sp. PtaB.Bin117 TaxID=1811694 RepID=UPI0009C6ACF9|nr:hypothetical protein [Pelotomaculum sp. PtaB.Bin117]OPX84052.1 MAG: hypothetical protein A4E54_03017 [Pelotomaculum sp. PtaB.Bin117]OPY59414.1 MAG: hypothetical protein A4E56_03208 [Pelotomaculum sp. PtaU1.Bin065]
MGCCDPDAPKIYKLNVGGVVVGLTGVEQAFLDVKELDLTGQEAAEKLLEIVERRNYIPESAEREYKIALHNEYKNYIARS